MEKEGRVTAEDVRTAWNKYANPNAGGWVSEPFEGVLLKMAKTGIPATDLGRYCDYAGLNSFARACHPIGLINAGNVEGAKEDILQVGQLYQTTNSRGLKWACVTGVAIAEGTKPGATVDSVIGAIFDPVSYTHLTLPTIYSVWISVVAVSLKKKKKIIKQILDTSLT